MCILTMTKISFSCGLGLQQNMAASGRELALCDLKDVVDPGHNKLWRAMDAKLRFSEIK